MTLYKSNIATTNAWTSAIYVCRYRVAKAAVNTLLWGQVCKAILVASANNILLVFYC